MRVEDQLDGPFESLLAAPLDLEAIALEVREVRTAEWFDAEQAPDWRVLLRATALLRTPVPQLIDRVRLLEQVADGRVPHRNHGTCPQGVDDPATRDSACRACRILGAPRVS
ncbi:MULTISPECIES: hypothetical protein [unclassified Rathayibacter]|uniref:hypothetical protein n=1 Tax=unclassified Rathayibacter TaxID=2609250 RepID=UPI001045471A|nr:MULTISPECIES: hypothetical protein [unclassified Rathayibacter]TCL79405.1 hypothetical protein EDF49_11141 [Rathayibacter sp. PhB192]TCM25326.1 hypothetical protein EDF43_111154 [Rathayibacter sp. PhB179]